MADQLQQKKHELEGLYKKLLDHQMNAMTGDDPPSKTDKQDLVRLYVDCTKTDTAINHLTTRARTCFKHLHVAHACKSFRHDFFEHFPWLKLCSV